MWQGAQLRQGAQKTQLLSEESYLGMDGESRETTVKQMNSKVIKVLKNYKQHAITCIPVLNELYIWISDKELTSHRACIMTIVYPFAD